MGWYIAATLILILAIGELASEIEYLKEQLHETSIILSRVAAKQQQNEVEND